MTDDRTTRESIADFLSESGSSDDVCAVPAQPARVRKLRPTFRPVPASHLSVAFPDGDSGFPGTKSFASRRTDSRAAGATVQSASAGPDDPPALAPRPDNPARRGASVLEARSAAPAVGPAVAAAEGGIGGRVRGRRAAGSPGRKAKAKQDASAPAIPASIANLIGKDKKIQDDSSSASPRLIPTESERQDARRLFREIGERFNVNRKRSKTAAYAAYRHDLMANLDTLIMGGAIDLKEVTTVITNLEQYTKETEAESTETPATILGKWLRMDAVEVAGLEVAVVEEEESGEEIDDLDAAADPADDGDSEADSTEQT